MIATLFANPSLRAEEVAPYAPYYNPSAGFRPAQRSLTQIFLQMAGSFEHFGTPEPYLRHVMAEHRRIDAEYEKATGRNITRRPDYFTDAYLDNLVATWKKLAPVLKLDDFCRTSGKNMRYAILGGWNRSTAELTIDETQLSEDEKATYRRLLTKDYFTKADFPVLEAFYKAPYDRLTEGGKEQLSQRTRRGAQTAEERQKATKAGQGGTILVSIFTEQQKRTLAFVQSETNEVINSDDLKTALIEGLKLEEKNVAWQSLPASKADALRFSHAIQDAYLSRMEQLRRQPIPPEQADKIEKALRILLTNLLVVAQSEFEAALNEELVEESPGK